MPVPSSGQIEKAKDKEYVKVRLRGHFAPNRQRRKASKHREFNRNLFMSDETLFMTDEKYHQRVAGKVVSIINQLIDPRNTSGMIEFPTMSSIDAVEKELPRPPRRHRRHGRCEPAEALAAFTLAWAAREDPRLYIRGHPRDRSGWKRH